MGLQNTAFFHDNAYHKITGWEYYGKKNMLRIRYEIYISKENKNKLIATEERQIDHSVFRINSRNDAEKALDMKIVNKLIEDRIGGRELTKPQIDNVKKEIKENEIVKLIYTISIKKMKEFFAEFIKNDSKEYCYKGLKMIKEFKNAIDD